MSGACDTPQIPNVDEDNFQIKYEQATNDNSKVDDVPARNVDTSYI